MHPETCPLACVCGGASVGRGVWGGLLKLGRGGWGALVLRGAVWLQEGLERMSSLGIWGSSLPGKESACNAGDLGSIAGLGRSPGEGKS